MTQKKTDIFTAFQGAVRIARGPLAEVAGIVKQAQETQGQNAILIFNLENGAQIDLDLSGSLAK